MSESDCEVLGLHGEGYRRVLTFGEWRVAVLTHSDFFSEENCFRLERHLETDEAFVLLEGEAYLVVGEACERMRMESGKLYNVKQGAWHAVITRPGAKMLIVENASTGKENSEYKEIK